MKRVILQITLMIVGSCAFAQLGTPMLQYYGNQLLFNPAYAGTNDYVLQTSLSVRKQWLQLPGSPTLVSLNAHAPFNDKRHAWGAVIQNETYGPLSRTLGYANYSYNLLLGAGVLRLGLQAGFQNHALNWNKIEYFRHPNDPELRTGTTGRTNFDVNVGAYFSTLDYYVGFSVKHLAPPKLNFDRNQLSSERWYPHPATQFFLNGGTNFNVAFDWSVKPEVILQYTSTSTLSVNIGAYAGYQHRYFFGINYQTVQNSLNFSLRGFVMENLQVSYSYGIYLNAFQVANHGSLHEISAIYRYKPINPFTLPTRFFD